MSEKLSNMYCKYCNYETKINSSWLRHIKSAKHLRQGKQKIHKCIQCDYESASTWNIKIHQLQIHATPEERAQQKYYCPTCDTVCFASAYFDRHINGRLHKTRTNVQQTLMELNN